MRFVMTYQDIMGNTRVLAFDEGDVESAAASSRQRAIDNTEWGEPEQTTYRNATPISLVDEDLNGYVLEERDGLVRLRDKLKRK